MATWADELTPVETGVFDRMLNQRDGTGIMVAGHRFGDNEGPEHTQPLLSRLLAITGFGGRTDGSGMAQRGMFECDAYLSNQDTAWASHNNAVETMTDAAIEADLLPLENGLGPARRLRISEILAQTEGILGLVETKSDESVDVVLDLYEAAGRRRDILVNSYEAARVDAAIARGFPGSYQYLSGAAPNSAALDAAVAAGVSAITVDRADVTDSTFPTLCHSKGLLVAVYTATSTTHYTDLRGYGVDIVITNVPTATFAV